jgi:signal peptidase I
VTANPDDGGREPFPPTGADSARPADDPDPIGESRPGGLEAGRDDEIAMSGPADPFRSSPAPTAAHAEIGGALARLREGAKQRGEKQDAARSFWRELPLLIVVALVVAVLIKSFLVQAFYIPSASMADTLVEGDRVMVNKLAYRFGEPARGDVIVFDNPAMEGGGESLLGAVLRHIGESLGLSSPDSALIKRVIGLPGETIQARNNEVLIDGSAIEEPYLGDGVRVRNFGPVEIPEGHVFVMGDNRGSSHDSRSFGPISEGDIVGKAFIKVWPPKRWSGV